jgi:Animal haem peroxidase
VPRTADGSAIIADPRNDENLVISGLQAAFIKFHDHMVDTVRSERLVRNTRSTSEVFQEARNQTRWHYQNMVLTQFLPQIIGQAMVDDILRRDRAIAAAHLARPGVEREIAMAQHARVGPSPRVPHRPATLAAS